MARRSIRIFNAVDALSEVLDSTTLYQVSDSSCEDGDESDGSDVGSES